MDGKRLMARNVYQVFRCFRNIIRFSSIQASAGRPRKFFAKNKTSAQTSGCGSRAPKYRVTSQGSRIVASLVSFNCFILLLLHFVPRQENYRSPPFHPPRLVWPVLARIVDSLSLSHTYIYVTSLSLFCISFYHYIYPSKAERRGWNRRGIAAGGSIVVD